VACPEARRACSNTPHAHHFVLGVPHDRLSWLKTMNWQAIIRRYKAKHYPNHIKERDWFAKQPSLRAVIENAAMALREDGKLYNHQRRIPKTSLEQARIILLCQETTINSCKKFEELLQIIEGIASQISGLGELYCYETALRIGIWLQIYPEKVYLHRGTRIGAHQIGFKGSVRFIELKELPEPLSSLPASEVEDILCIFKDKFS